MKTSKSQRAKASTKKRSSKKTVKKKTSRASAKKKSAKKKKIQRKSTKKATRKSTKKVASTSKRLSSASVINQVGRSIAERALSGQLSSSEMERLLLRKPGVNQHEEKRKIAMDMLERYTGHSMKDFKKQIILTNFHYYIERFNSLLDDTHYTIGSAFKASSSSKADITIIEFGIGSAMAALVMELVSVTHPKAVLFLGMCGAVHHSLKVGDFVLPIAAIRAEGVSGHFLPPQVPALPTFKVQKFVSQVIVEHGHDYRTGSIHSTDLRFWEFDEKFKQNLYHERVLAVEMETAALFITGFLNKVSIGALLLVSDTPLKPDGIKTKKSASRVFRKYTDIHIELGIEIMADIAERGENIRAYRW